VSTEVRALEVRFNGLRSETTRDAFSRLFDFEGYRVYLGRDERSSSFTMLASYDLPDFNKYVWNDRTFNYDLKDAPFSLTELRCLYGDSCNDTTFRPADYSRNSPYHHPLFPESTFYFAAQDFNCSELGRTTPIRKIYPEQPYPSSLNPDSARPEELTEDGYLKYFEYEFRVDGLLPTVPYWVNVTAFDFGSPESGLASLETPVDRGAQMAYALDDWATVEEKGLEAFIYPNPYRVDGDYRGRGFEGRTEIDRPRERVRTLNFANIPLRCTIRIFTIDGDLVREFDHEGSNHAEWNLITRNTQSIVPGLYYWTVEDLETGRVQMGKLAVVM
jgi:hypothetical protein